MTGVVEGAGRIFTVFVFLRFVFRRAQGQMTAIYFQSRECHFDPVCTDLVQNFVALNVSELGGS